MDRETLCTIALSQVKGLGGNALLLYKDAGGAAAIVDNRHNICDLVPNCNVKLAQLVDEGLDMAMERAKREAELIDTHSMTAIPFNDSRYPDRLRYCNDSPLLLYYSGNAELNAKKIISIVGTRRCTAYGRDLCREFVADVAKAVPDCLIVSGLAYGIDVCAHTSALENNLNTVGVLAHGLEKIYPQVHRPIAVKMTRMGGLLTEYITNSVIDKGNFVKRNRIVAGMCDAALVVESADKGGSLITANIANSYGREVFAFPGRVYDEASKGCNRLIRTNMAMAITSAEDFLKAMNWQSQRDVSKSARQTELFNNLDETQQRVIKLLASADCMTTSEIAQGLKLDYNEVNSIMFDLEMSSIVAAAGLLRYRLLRRDL